MYLSANVSNEGGTEDDIKARLGKARVAYNKLDKFWKNSQFTIKTKINVFKSNVISVLLYGCETWRTTKADDKKLDAFLHKSLRRILKICWPMRITNEEVRRRAGIRETNRPNGKAEMDMARPCAQNVSFWVEDSICRTGTAVNAD